jgi:hypothetical protein
MATVSFQTALRDSLRSILRPIVRLMLRSGLGYSEFITVAKIEFVRVASEEYGIRGRPTNVSRIAAMTGLSRKEVRKVRDQRGMVRWTPERETTPASTVIHFWQFDPQYSNGAGHPRPLVLEGDDGFAGLVGKYAGDIPVGAMRTELSRMGAVVVDDNERIHLVKHYVHPTGINEDFIRNVAFSLGNLGNTLAHNAELIGRFESGDSSSHPVLGRFERTAWTEHLSAEAQKSFGTWVRAKGTDFVELADQWIGQHELPREEWPASTPRTVGVGVYFFEE